MFRGERNPKKLFCKLFSKKDILKPTGTAADTGQTPPP
jgi:hypothetical protein